jgi:hypothetical protein
MSDRVDGRVDDIRTRLEGIAEELADLSMEALREAVEQGAQKRPPAERTFTQARRAVEKAAHLLGG